MHLRWITCWIIWLLLIPLFEIFALASVANDENLHFRFNEKKQLEASIDSNGNETRYFYDETGRLVKIVYPAVLNERDEIIHPTENIFYENQDFIIEDANGYHIHAKYDSQGQLSEIVYPDGTTLPYNSNTHIKWVTPPLSSNIEETDSTFAEDRQFLNERGQYVRQRETVNAYGLRKIETYDVLDRLEHLVSFDSKGQKWTEIDFRYDGRGNKVLERHYVLREGKQTRIYQLAWKYDEMNRIIAMTEEPNTSHAKTTQYHYNTNGQLDSITKPDGVKLIYTYDKTDQLRQVQASDHSLEYRFEYDQQQRLTAIYDLIQNRSIVRHYQDLDKYTEEQLGSLRIQNRYDSKGNRIALVLPDDSEIRYQYNEGRLEIVQRFSKTGQLQYEHQYVYEAETDRLLESRLIKNLGKIIYQYDSKGRLIKAQSPWWSEEIGDKGYDANENLVQRTLTDPAGVLYQTIAYSEDEQLKQEKGIHCCEYHYDSLFNCLGKENEKWQINASNQLVFTPQAAFRYDQNGNLIEKRTQDVVWQYEYDALDRLIKAVKNQQLAITYHYDALHRRLSQSFYQKTEDQWKKEKTEYFLYDGDLEIGKTDEQGNVLELRILGVGFGADIGSAVALEIQGKIYAPIHDSQGSIRCLVDIESGKPNEFYRYTAYGEEQLFDQNGQEIDAKNSVNPWRYSSKRKDESLDLIFFGRRYYDPQIGRWITPDPLLSCETPNVYAFLKNNPFNHYDMYGLFSLRSIGSSILTALCQGFYRLHYASSHLGEAFCREFKMAEQLLVSIDRGARKFLGENIVLLMGTQIDESSAGMYGEHEISDKIRVTFINGILTTKHTVVENLDLISKTHGNVFVHYIFCSTEGWLRDICKAGLVKFGFLFGFRSKNALALANLWKKLIQDMGGPNSGGTIIHYAHSLGGSETDTARDLLTPEEQRMIRVTTFGSATLIANGGFEQVINYVSNRDGVTRCFNRFHPHLNLKLHQVNGLWPIFPLDHLLNGITYKPIIEQLGKQFLLDFAPAYSE